jgi:hypothetical protein
MLKIQSCVGFIDKSHEILGNALKIEIMCAEKYGELTRAQLGLRIWGYLARTLATRSFKQSPWWLDEKNNGRTTPQNE